MDRMLKSVSPQYRSERPAIEKAEKIWKFSSPQYGSQRTGNRVLRFSDEERAGGGNRAVRFSESQRSASRVLRLTEDQEAVLREQFNRWPRAPHTGDVVLLAAETGLSEADVKDWYAIRLAQWRKEQGLGGNLGLH